MSDARYVLVITQDPKLQKLAAALEAESISAETVGSFVEASRALEHHSRCVCVMDSALPSELAVRVAQLFSRFQAQRTVILADPDVFSALAAKDAWAKGVDICPKHDSYEETVLRLKAILIFAGYDIRISDSARGMQPVAQSSMTRGEVVAVFSVKGGVGKSTIAVNLAAGLLQIHGAKPLIIDANLYFGDVPVLLDVSPKRSIFDLCDLKELDTVTLKRVVTEHKSGLSVLASPPDFTTVEMLNTETLLNAISLYRSLFDYVVIDTRTSFDEATLQILDVADRIVLVTTPEIGAVYQTARFLEVAEALGYRDRLLLVLNRAGSGLGMKSVEENLGTTVSASIVSAGRPVLSAANRGTPLLLDDPDRKERISKDLAGVVELIRKPMPLRPGLRSNSKKSLGARVESLLRSDAL